MSSKRVTLKDIAERCGVSKPTVSMIMNNRLNGFPVRKETIERVRSVARELGYVPNRFARALVTQSSKFIAYSVPYPDPATLRNGELDSAIRATDPCLMAGMVACCAEKGYDVVTVPRFEDKYKVLPSDQVAPDGVDGVAWLLPSVAHQEYLDVVNKGGNLILVGQKPGVSNIPYCDFDNEYEAYRLTKHLIDSGAKRVGFVCVTFPDYEVGRLRMKGYRKALDEAGLEICQDDLFLDSDLFAGPDTAVIERALKQRVSKGRGRIDGLVVSCGHFTTKILEAMKNCGVDPYSDIHVGSFIEYGEPLYGYDGITVLQTCRFEVGYHAAEMLIEAASGVDIKGRFKKIPCRLKPRFQSSETPKVFGPVRYRM